jgi:phosphoglycerate dehydrogenase-like enzyme
MSWKVLITARTLHEVGASAVALMKQAGLELVMAPRFGPLPADELMEQLEGVDAVLASMDKFNATVLGCAAARQLKLISRWGVGYDAIDVPTATRQGIVIAYTPGLLNDAVADYAFALLLAISRRVHEAHLDMRQGKWNALFGHDVSGKTLGIVGCGRIGQAMARRASGFNMRVLGYDIAPHPEAKALGIEFVELDELLERSDFVSLHAALTPTNRGMIGEKRLRRMKPTAHLINTARGALIDEAALIQALEEQWIAGAALDAYETEPLPASHPLTRAPRILLSPHHSSFGRDTGEKVSMAAAQAIVDLAGGMRPEMVVNPEVFDSPALRAQLK